ncbi:MAG: glycerate kinase [Anaerolineae bacterium]|nr:glycerate kinase [Anaerolineae bacterium]MDW8098998.1 glycerate kinase [Anaerolineae bacterium]
MDSPVETLNPCRRQQLIEIMTAALRAVDPAEAVRRHLQRQGDILQVGGAHYDLRRFRRVIVVGGGKAGAPMAAAVMEILGDCVAGGAVVVKYGHTAPSGTWRVRFGHGDGVPASQEPLSLGPVELIEAGHPIPDAAGLKGAQRVLSWLRNLSAEDLVICLISGGGSALLPAPAEGLHLEDKQALTEMLLRAGATINEINAVRKHCSLLKGGQLARQAAPATLITLVLSDVVGSPLDVIASGPTVPDLSTFADAYAVLERYGLVEQAPASIVARLRQGMAGALAETPKPGDPCFKRVQTVVVGDNRIAAQAAAECARQLGFSTQVLTTFIEGEAREVARVCAALLKEEVQTDAPLPRPACLILGGETTVTVRGHGRGGRNQELALAAALALDGWPDVAIISLGTDGTDGPTNAAGALATGWTVRAGKAIGLDAAAMLSDNDAYRFFSALGDLIITGPTGTNVNDLILGLAWPG